MDEEVLITVKSLSKKFSKNLRKSLRYGVQDITRELFGKSRMKSLRKSEFWAVNNISFELKRGECLGLIGHNGAGKSTLLKMLNGLIKPDAGSIEIHGRVAALIELGAGFDPILTGRENIYNNASVLGFTRNEVDLKLDEIIEFSEIGEFIDAPVQSYSSGMKVRLGFAVAAQMEPDVLIIDEVLAVGDAGFRTKCFAKIGELMKNTCIILVSHAMPMVGRYASKILLMDKGELSYFTTNVAQGIEEYYNLFPNREKSNFLLGDTEVQKIFINHNEVLPKEETIITYGSKLEIKTHLVNKSSKSDRSGILRFTIINSEGQVIAVTKSDLIDFNDTNKSVKLMLPALYIKSGLYNVSISIRTSDDLHNISWYANYFKLKIQGGYNDYGAAFIAYPNEMYIE